MNPSSSNSNSLLPQQLQEAANATDHVVVMPDQMSFMMPPSIAMGMNNGLNSSRNGVVAIQTQPAPMNILSYPENSINPTLNGDGGITGSLNPTLVPYSYISNDTLPYHQQEMQMPMMAVDNMQDNQEYMYQQDYNQFPCTQANFSLKPPKRQMSAYTCYSRKVFNEVKSRMPSQSRQSDIFREIAKQWKGMSPEEKQPFVEEAKEDKKRKKEEDQKYNHIRKEIEKGYEAGGSAFFRIAETQGSNRALQTAFSEKDAKHLASLLLRVNSCNIKSTIDILREVTRVMPTPEFASYYEKADLHSSNTDLVQPSSSMIIKENGTAQYKCTVEGCNKVFNWKSNLNVHMKTHDKNRTRDFVCPEPNCGKKFFDQQHLKQHMQIHRRTPNSYVCTYPGCTKKYSTPGGLKLHIKSHHQIDKKYKCDVQGCDRAFVRKTDLKMHKLRVHSDSKPYICHFPNCDKSYVSQSELNRHMQTHKFSEPNGSTIVV